MPVLPAIFMCYKTQDESFWLSVVVRVATFARQREELNAICRAGHTSPNKTFTNALSPGELRARTGLTMLCRGAQVVSPECLSCAPYRGRMAHTGCRTATLIVISQIIESQAFTLGKIETHL